MEYPKFPKDSCRVDPRAIVKWPIFNTELFKKWNLDSDSKIMDPLHKLVDFAIDPINKTLKGSYKLGDSVVNLETNIRSKFDASSKLFVWYDFHSDFDIVKFVISSDEIEDIWYTYNSTRIDWIKISDIGKWEPCVYIPKVTTFASININIKFRTSDLSNFLVSLEEKVWPTLPTPIKCMSSFYYYETASGIKTIITSGGIVGVVDGKEDVGKLLENKVDIIASPCDIFPNLSGVFTIEKIGTSGMVKMYTKDPKDEHQDRGTFENPDIYMDEFDDVGGREDTPWIKILVVSESERWDLDEVLDIYSASNTFDLKANQSVVYSFMGGPWTMSRSKFDETHDTNLESWNRYSNGLKYFDYDNFIFAGWLFVIDSVAPNVVETLKNAGYRAYIRNEHIRVYSEIGLKMLNEKLAEKVAIENEKIATIVNHVKSLYDNQEVDQFLQL